MTTVKKLSGVLCDAANLPSELLDEKLLVSRTDQVVLERIEQLINDAAGLLNELEARVEKRDAGE